MHHIGDGLSSIESAELFIGSRSKRYWVEDERKRMYNQLGANGQNHAVRLAFEQRLAFSWLWPELADENIAPGLVHSTAEGVGHEVDQAGLNQLGAGLVAL
jgi:hypothetical protein